MQYFRGCYIFGTKGGGGIFLLLYTSYLNLICHSVVRALTKDFMEMTGKISFLPFPQLLAESKAREKK